MYYFLVVCSCIIMICNIKINTTNIICLKNAKHVLQACLFKFNLLCSPLMDSYNCISHHNVSNFHFSYFTTLLQYWINN